MAVFAMPLSSVSMASYRECSIHTITAAGIDKNTLAWPTGQHRHSPVQTLVKQSSMFSYNYNVLITSPAHPHIQLDRWTEGRNIQEYIKANQLEYCDRERTVIELYCICLFSVYYLVNYVACLLHNPMEIWLRKGDPDELK